PAITFPRFPELFSGARDGLKRPAELSGMDVPGADVAGRPLRRIFLSQSTGDDQVLEHDRRRTETISSGQILQDLRRIQIDDAVIAESVVRLARAGIDRKQV